jgi:hypothetical protein
MNERKRTSENGSVKIRRKRPVPEIIDPVFAKTSQNARFLLSENERFGLVFVKTGSINSGTEVHLRSKGLRYKPTQNDQRSRLGWFSFNSLMTSLVSKNIR